MAQMERVMISSVSVDVVVTVSSCELPNLCDSRRCHSLVCPSGHTSVSSTMMMTSTPTHRPQVSGVSDSYDGKLPSGYGKEAESP